MPRFIRLAAALGFARSRRSGPDPPAIRRPSERPRQPAAPLAAKSRSIRPENFTGEKGKGGMATEGTGARARARPRPGLEGLALGRRSSRARRFTLAEIDGPGAIQHIWMTPTGDWRYSILRIYWDGETSRRSRSRSATSSLAAGARYAQVSSLAVCVNPGSAFNCYWAMPFRKRRRITLENIDDEAMTLYYQINYALTDVPDDAAYFHAQFRRVNPLPYKQVYTILDGMKGQGHYVGTYMAWGVNNNGWWGEGEIKFFMDGDSEFPTICGTGTEDYFCGSYNFENQDTQAVPGVHDAVRGHAAGDPARRPLPVAAALRPVPLARHRPDPLRAGPAGHDAGAGLARAAAATCRSRTTSRRSRTGTRREPHAPFPKLPPKDALEIQ